MTEGEILSVRNELTAIVVSVASFSFAMISAYIVGLWPVLRDAPFSLRTLAFVLLTSGLACMGVMSAGLNTILPGTETAWSKLAKTATELPGFGNSRPDYRAGPNALRIRRRAGRYRLRSDLFGAVLPNVLLPLARCFRTWWGHLS